MMGQAQKESGPGAAQRIPALVEDLASSGIRFAHAIDLGNGRGPITILLNEFEDKTLRAEKLLAMFKKEIPEAELRKRSFVGSLRSRLKLTGEDWEMARLFSETSKAAWIHELSPDERIHFRKLFEEIGTQVTFRLDDLRQIAAFKGAHDVLELDPLGLQIRYYNLVKLLEGRNSRSAVDYVLTSMGMTVVDWTAFDAEKNREAELQKAAREEGFAANEGYRKEEEAKRARLKEMEERLAQAEAEARYSAIVVKQERDRKEWEYNAARAAQDAFIQSTKGRGP